MGHVVQQSCEGQLAYLASGTFANSMSFLTAFSAFDDLKVTIVLLYCGFILSNYVR